MFKGLKPAALVLSVAIVLSANILSAGEKEESVATAMAEYLLSARAVLAQNQKLINDPAKGDKGFTPAVYEQQVRMEFLSRTSADITKMGDDDFGKALSDIHQSAKLVVAEAQPVINQQGKGFKGYNPAAFGAKVGATLEKRSQLRIKQTSLQFRADHNKPDEYETAVLKKFALGKGEQVHVEETELNGQKVLRYLVPLYVGKSCLTCHGDPAGSVDVSGYKREGYKEGELRGAISVAVPVM
ncbi:putative PAS/PAC sensor protein [Citrifermentans bremense]|uniref:Putative PAS/PAC sensor protein n=1 Tax=Citrifermentans bremense TaxID=60035 RepID=A0A6S6M030_9BACT|nr:DUF3365 domain-containing protein [Citrifermentans bremense]BCG45546.1 putative PAS/PAC sensor protein [Citrifermentans bremense]